MLAAGLFYIFPARYRGPKCSLRSPNKTAEWSALFTCSLCDTVVFTTVRVNPDSGKIPMTDLPRKMIYPSSNSIRLFHKVGSNHFKETPPRLALNAVSLEAI